jgi:glucose-induced degradation protein 8
MMSTTINGNLSEQNHAEIDLYIFNYSDSTKQPSNLVCSSGTSFAALTSPSSDINALILDYLTLAGYPNAAKKFSTEANLPPQQSHDSIEARQQIQTAIHRGDIAQAISDLNDLDPEVCGFLG